ncbi:MAG TPA: hypothetical protein VEC35_22520 [Noviherbaspirillum sp.]|nr:hypothetical protein [Noviherbaspirillum sp.]
MMDGLLTHLADRACREKAVVSSSFTQGMQLLAYPIDNGVLVAVGFGPERVRNVPVERVLRRRTEQPGRFGVWLPAAFADGSWYMVRRATRDTFGRLPLPSSDELASVQELMT